jgi:hypothetical protein
MMNWLAVSTSKSVLSSEPSRSTTSGVMVIVSEIIDVIILVERL